VETYTLREAADLTGMTVQALRRRADRGSLRTVHQAGVRRVPRSELQRAGLRVGPPESPTETVRELVATIDRQATELARLRALPERIDAERSRAEDLAAQLAAAEQAAADLAAWQQRLTASNWRERRRLLRAARC